MNDKRKPAGLQSSWTAPKELLADVPEGMDVDGSDSRVADTSSANRRAITSRENDYQKQRLLRPLSPDRTDAFAPSNSIKRNEKSSLSSSSSHSNLPVLSRSYVEVMREKQVERDRAEIKRRLKAIEASGSIPIQDLPKQYVAGSYDEHKVVEKASLEQNYVVSKPRKRSRWDVSAEAKDTSANNSHVATELNAKPVTTPAAISEWDRPDDEEESFNVKPRARKSRWDRAPETDNLLNGAVGDKTPVMTAETAGETPVFKSNIDGWALTPKITSGGDANDNLAQTASRWAETPVVSSGESFERPLSAFPTVAQTITAQLTDTTSLDPRWAKELEIRNRYLSDEELDSLLPSEGYKIVDPPSSYIPPPTKIMSTPVVSSGSADGFFIQEGEVRAQDLGLEAVEISAGENLPSLKPDDIQFFGKLLEKKADADLSLDEAKERKIMRLLLRIKNGTAQMRRNSLKEISERARYFGAGPLFNQILPLLMSPTLEDQERHLLIKVIDKILFRLDDLVRPYVHKILVVVEPLLIDEDFYARVEGREIISNLSKAAGLATMISVMRPDIDHVDEYVRNTTARALSVVASALGIQSLLPFLKAVCRSKKSWQARHTGIKIVQQIAILMGCAILPHLKNMVDAIEHGLADDQLKVRIMSALAVANLAEAASPFGIESFDGILRPLWNGIQKHRGKGLAAFIKAIGALIPLMDAEYSGWYATRIMDVLVREFSSPDEEMKKIVLKVVRQCVATDSIKSDYVKDEIIRDFLLNFWVRRMALDRRNYREVVETTVAFAKKVGGGFMIEQILVNLKDEAEPFRKMTMHAIQQIITELGSHDIEDRLLQLLVDGMQSAFLEQTAEDSIFLDGIGCVMKSLGPKCIPFLPPLCSSILWRLQNKSANVRQYAAELISRIAPLLSECGEDKLLAQFGAVLYEFLGEEYPDVLGSIISGLKSIVNVIGMINMNPPIKDLLPRLTPILRNRHEKVQENTIDLIGRIAERGPEHVSAREWMRICFELLETLKAPRKSIRKAAINTVGHIAKAIGPQDVLATLLNNLKVQERQNRVCTTIAIAIVSETCAPFTVLPALMNEYRVPDLNVQNGVLKSLSFMFEYIGDMAKDYVYALTPLLEDALMDRDLVHRQTACTAVKHLALGCYGRNCEDALLHLLNYVWPNIFETTAHMSSAFMEAVEALRLALGPGVILPYLLQGLFHPARKVREAYWKVYNSMYIASQDALIPFYPTIPDTDQNSYQRYELDYIL